MAKQIKWRQVDDATQVSIAIAHPDTGPANPKLTDLEQHFDMDAWRYGTCADSVTINSASNDNFIFEISDADYIADIKSKIETQVKTWKEEVYEYEKEVRSGKLSTYHDTSYTAGAGYKYDAAVAFLSSGTANAGLTTEANLRGISVTALANKIKTNHEEFIIKDAQISGLRGMLCDRIDSIGINTSSVTAALASYAGIHTEEKLGEMNMGDGGETLDINAGYYNPAGLSLRFDYI